jgi:amino acid transporter
MINVYDVAFRKKLDENGSYQYSPLSVIFSVIFMLCAFFTGLNHTILPIRMTYALARDNGLPGSSWLRKLNPVSKIPDNIVLTFFVLDSLLCVIPLFSL